MTTKSKHPMRSAPTLRNDHAAVSSAPHPLPSARISSTSLSKELDSLEDRITDGVQAVAELGEKLQPLLFQSPSSAREAIEERTDACDLVRRVDYLRQRVERLTENVQYLTSITQI